MGRLLEGCLLCIAVFLTAATVRTFFDGRSHITAGKALLEAGDRSGAVAAFEEAAKSYTPGSPYSNQALREMEIVAKGYLMRGDNKESLRVWQVVRRSILATRHIFQPNGDILATAEAQIQGLSDPDSTNSEYGNPLRRPPSVSPLGSILLFLGLLSFVAGALALCLGRYISDKATTASSMGAWIVSMGGLALWIAMSWVIR